MESIWVFSGVGSHFPAGIFSSRDKAEVWVRAHHLSGTLTKYPVDIGLYDWALAHGFFHVRAEDQKAPEFIQRFTTASQEHHHYQDGLCCV